MDSGSFSNIALFFNVQMFCSKKSGIPAAASINYRPACSVFCSPASLPAPMIERSKMSHIKVGIIGGSGLDNPQLFADRTEIEKDTPFGKPSDVLVTGQIGGIDCVLIARHGKGHSIMPTNVNNRANIFALKSMGCTNIIATSASGSLQPHIKPGEFVIVDQFIDMTKQRKSTFYDGQPGSPAGVSHIPMDEPFCPKTRQLFKESCEGLGVAHHPEGTVLTIEGPRFSTKAESRLWKSWGAHVINMSTVPEVCLAKEAGIPYGLICMATDYDSWNEEEHMVSVHRVLSTFRHNAETATKILLDIIPRLAKVDWDPIWSECKSTVFTSVMGMT